MKKEYKILLVDDDPNVISGIVDIFEKKNSEYICYQSINGEMAYEVAQNVLPDLIITDWEMPICTGIELIERLKRDEQLCDVPIIMCTGIMISSANLRTALNAGAVDYIRKPVDKLELLARVRSMLELSESHKQIKAQNKILEQKNEEIKAQRDELQSQKQEITDSIRYAKRIQTAILPSPTMLKQQLPEHFILLKPRNIVSGDFFWTVKMDEWLVIAAADCTGHGVPGAFMSMLGISYLNEIVLHGKQNNPSEILDKLRETVKTSFHPSGEIEETKDGMDIALCVVNTKSNKLYFSGAYNPLYIVSSNNVNELLELPADRMPIGSYIVEKPFSKQEYMLQKGDTIYLFSDGYYDQLGGTVGRKFMKKRFRKLLLSIQNESMRQQKQILNDTIDQWKGNEEQVDDILIFGVRF